LADAMWPYKNRQSNKQMDGSNAYCGSIFLIFINYLLIDKNVLSTVIYYLWVGFVFRLILPLLFNFYWRTHSKAFVWPIMITWHVQRRTLQEIQILFISSLICWPFYITVSESNKVQA
jgi:hypothetical protein